MIKIRNVRDIGYLFHYSHFLSDCLMPEIEQDIHKYDIVIRPKYLSQALGNFTGLYENIMGVSNIEVPIEQYNGLDIEEKIIIGCNGKYSNKLVDKCKNLILDKYSIKKDKFYPPVILIKRGKVNNLITGLDNYDIDPNYIFDEYFNDKNLANGKDRRCIDNIELLEAYLDSKKVFYKTLVLEDLTFEQQLKYFYNANLVIGAHGAGLCNLMFCKKNTHVLEVLPLKLPLNIIKNSIYWFKNISDSNNLKYKSCLNNTNEIINILDELQKRKL